VFFLGGTMINDERVIRRGEGRSLLRKGFAGLAAAASLSLLLMGESHAAMSVSWSRR